jgi:hypothetical protein
VEVVAADSGAGIADPTAAFSGVRDAAAAKTRGLGMGLAGSVRLADELDADVRAGEGTMIRARKFVSPPPARREIGVFGRALPDEHSSGDGAAFLHTGTDTLLVVADGLGHGPEAQQASLQALAAATAHPGASPLDAVRAACDALENTRGAVLSVVRADEKRNLSHVGLGDIRVEIVGPGEVSRRLRSWSGYAAGMRTRIPKSADSVLAPGAIVLMTTDGIKSAARVHQDLALVRKHPIIVAHHVATTFARPTDDLLVLVARL